MRSKFIANGSFRSKTFGVGTTYPLFGLDPCRLFMCLIVRLWCSTPNILQPLAPSTAHSAAAY